MRTEIPLEQGRAITGSGLGGSAVRGSKLNPAYQNPDRRGRAGVTRGYRDDRGWKSLAILRLSPFKEEFLGQPLYVGLARSYECSRRTIHLSRGIVR